MEILSHGKYFKYDKGIHKCLYCECKYRYETKDVHLLKDSNGITHTLLICPECRERNYLD